MLHVHMQQYYAPEKKAFKPGWQSMRRLEAIQPDVERKAHEQRKVGFGVFRVSGDGQTAGTQWPVQPYVAASGQCALDYFRGQHTVGRWFT